MHIIAELAQGFEGSYSQSRSLLRAAAAAGADSAKFQLVYADELATPDYKYYDLFRLLEMTDKEWQYLADYATELKIEMYLDIFGSRSLGLCETIGVKAVKLHGTDIANIGLLNEVAASVIGKVILGAGGAYLSEIETALGILKNKEVIVLLGYQGYPTADGTNQISRIGLLQDQLAKKHSGFVIGFADHADPGSPLRYALAATAVGAGATVIEKHLTLGQVMKMEDHESALNPDEFAEFSKVVRTCADAYGSSVISEDFSMSDGEKTYRKMIRRHVVSSRNLTKGSTLTTEDIILKRTSSEQIITDLGEVYNKIINRDIPSNSAITPADINQIS